MSCLIKAMKMGLTIDGDGRHVKNKDFPDAFKLIKYYTPCSLVEIYDAWESKISKYYKDALVESAISLFNKNGLDMDSILNELNNLPHEANKLIKAVKEKWDLWDALEEQLASASELDARISLLTKN